MAFIDDWGATSELDKKHLQERCQRMGCGHMRYLHGDSRMVRAAVKTIAYEAGKCVRCRCVAFQGDAAIQPDEILDATEALAGDVHLADFGIGVLCAQVITRWIGENQTIDVPCGLKPQHEGAHEAKE